MSHHTVEQHIPLGVHGHPPHQNIHVLGPEPDEKCSNRSIYFKQLKDVVAQKRGVLVINLEGAPMDVESKVHTLSKVPCNRAPHLRLPHCSTMGMPKQRIPRTFRCCLHQAWADARAMIVRKRREVKRGNMKQKHLACDAVHINN